MFIVTDNAGINTTEVTINPAVLPDDVHVVAGAYDIGNADLVLTHTDGSIVTIDLTAVGGGADDYVSS